MHVMRTEACQHRQVSSGHVEGLEQVQRLKLMAWIASFPVSTLNGSGMMCVMCTPLGSQRA